jgi:hypothetical protein
MLFENTSLYAFPNPNAIQKTKVQEIKTTIQLLLNAMPNAVNLKRSLFDMHQKKKKNLRVRI